MKIVYASAYLIAAGIILFFAVRASKRKEKIAHTLAGTLFPAGGICVAYLFVLLSEVAVIQSLAFSVVFVCFDYLLMGLYRFIAEFVKYRIHRQIDNIMRLFVAADSLILISNPIHKMALTYERTMFGGESYLRLVPDTWYNIHLTFSYIIVVLVFSYLIVKTIKAASVYKSKYITMLVVIVAIVIADFLFVFNVIECPVDFSYAALGAGATVIYYYTFMYKDYFLVARGRYLVMENVSIPIVLFDDDGIMADYNSCSRELFRFCDDDKRCLEIEEFRERIPGERQDFTNCDTKEFFTEIEKNARKLKFKVNYMCIRDKYGRCAGRLFAFNDVTELVRMNLELEEIANFDQATGLHNKVSLGKELDRIQKEGAENICIVVCGISGINFINDIFGDTYGDRVVKYVADIIQKNVKQQDFIARTAIDELVILMSDTTVAEAEEVFGKVISCLEDNEEFEFEVRIEYGLQNARKGEYLSDAVVNTRNIMNRKRMLVSNNENASINAIIIKSLMGNNCKENIDILKELCDGFGRHIGLSEKELHDIELVAVLHDIGNSSIPEGLLAKPSRLTKEEWDTIKLHTIRGYHIANAMSETVDIADYILYHHESWDGKGYIHQLKGKNIPELSRIFAIIEAYVVMTHDRAYRLAITSEEALEEIERCSGTQFDPYYAGRFVEYIRKKGIKF